MKLMTRHINITYIRMNHRWQINILTIMKIIPAINNFIRAAYNFARFEKKCCEHFWSYRNPKKTTTVFALKLRIFFRFSFFIFYNIQKSSNVTIMLFISPYRGMFFSKNKTWKIKKSNLFIQIVKIISIFFNFENNYMSLNIVNIYKNMYIIF